MLTGNPASESQRIAWLDEQLRALADQEVDLGILIQDEDVPELARQCAVYVLQLLIHNEMSLRPENQE